MENEHDETSFESFQFIDDEIQSLMSLDPVPDTGNSFTALLDLPPNQAVKLLHSPDGFFSVFPATERITEILPRSGVNNNNNWNPVKREAIETGYSRNSSPVFSDLKSKSKSAKRNDMQKVRLSARNIKNAVKESDGEEVQYIHVRARRGEATDSHSLAERARREKINTRMKLLRDLVPGCKKISGTAMVLEKIINHVQSLQLQVEFLSMKLAVVQPDIDINLDNLFSSEFGSPMEFNFSGMVPPPWWVNRQVNVNKEQIW